MGLKLNFAWNRHSSRVERKEEVEGADFRRGLVRACVVHGMLECPVPQVNCYNLAAQRTLQICSGWRGGLDTLVFSGAITDSKFPYDGFFILENVNRALVARSTVPQDPFGLGAFSEICPVNLICVCEPQ